MTHAMLLALSINGGIKTLGAYAGLAAVIVLALLILLYFAQARELRRLNERLSEMINRQAAQVPVRPPPPPTAAQPVGSPPAGVPRPVPQPAIAPLPGGAVPLLAPRPQGASPVA